jgi:ferritin
MPTERFIEALNEQIAAEFAASHQYVAIAVHYENETYPRLADFFYRQALEEREHAMMMVKYLLDTRAPARLREVEAPRGDFADHVAPIELAVEQEGAVSRRISEIFALAREEEDFLSEQFMQWFLKEQVEEEATMSTLLDVAERTRDYPMTLEEYMAREHPGGEADDPLAPEPAGGR